MACAIASSALLDTKSQPLVRADHVSRLFVGAGGRDILALKDITLEIEAGEFIVLVGPSGCGKSTLLRVLAGLDTPTSGVVEIAGQQGNYSAAWSYLPVSTVRPVTLSVAYSSGQHGLCNRTPALDVPA